MPQRHRHIVAVVDDDPGVRDSLRFLLETAGHEVETYASAAGFLAGADPRRLSCLVLDQRMPKVAGLDLLVQLRGEGIATPTLLIASTVAPALRQQAARLGVRCVLEKPLAHDDLLAQIDSVMA